LVENGTAPGAPDLYNTAYADFSANFIVPKMVQRVVVDGYDFDRAMDEAQQQGQAIYDKYK
jgi:multiple sugar transport system substrate-binding protein